MAEHHEVVNYCYKIQITITSATDRQYTPVAVVMQAGDMVGQGVMSYWGWDVLPKSASLADLEATLQDLSSNTSRWWVLVPSLSAGAPYNTYIYLGNRKAKRDQAVFFSGQDKVERATDTGLDLTNNFRLEVVATTDQPHPAPGWLVAKYDESSGTGYRLGVVDVGGQRKVRGQVNGAVLDVAWDGSEKQIRMEFRAPTLEILYDGVSQGTLNTGLSSAGTNAQPLQVGVGLKGVVREVGLVRDLTTTPAWVMRWSFNPRDMTETSASPPVYTGTVADTSGNGRTGTYTWNRDQTGLTVTVGNIVPTFADPALTVQWRPQSLLGPGAATDLFGTDPSRARHLPLFGVFDAARQAVGLTDTTFWLLLATFVGAIVGGLVYILLGALPASLGAIGVVLVVGNVAGLIPPWVTIFFGLASVGVFGLWRLGRE